MKQPKSAKHIGNILLYLLLLSAFLQGCKPPTKDHDPINTNISVKEDTINNWLGKPSSFFDTSFHTIFYNKFNAYIASNDIYSATKILLSTGRTSLSNYQPDSLLANTTIQFLNKYSIFIKPVDYADLLMNIGSLYSQAGEYQKANEYFNRIMLDTSNAEITNIYASSRREMLYNHLYTGNSDKALSCGFEALKYDLRSKSKIDKAGTCAGIAGVYLYNNNIDKALLFLDYAISIIEKENDTSGLFILKSNRIAIYLNFNHPKLLSSIDSLLSLFDKWKPENPKFIVDALSWKTIKYIKQGNMPAASQLIDSLKKIGSSPEVSEFDYSNFFLAQAEFEKALNKPISDKSMYLKLLPELWHSRQYHLLLFYYDLLQKDAYNSGDYKNAYQYNISYNIAKDSLSGLTVKTKIIDLENSYESKQLEYKLLEKDHKLSNLKSLIIILIEIIISIICITASIYFIVKIRHLRKERKSIVRFTNHLFEKMEEERMRLASDIHDSIGHDLLYLKNKISKIDPTMGTEIDGMIQTVRNISRNLHPSLFEISGLILSLEQLIERLQQSTHILINTEFEYNSGLSSRKELQIYRIIQEALSNIIKYSNSIAALVKISETDNAVLIKVADNGIGFNVEEKLNSNSSFGILSIMERTKALNGKIFIKSNSKGTIISIEIPKNENSNYSR